MNPYSFLNEKVLHDLNALPFIEHGTDQNAPSPPQDRVQVAQPQSTSQLEPSVEPELAAEPEPVAEPESTTQLEETSRSEPAVESENLIRSITDLLQSDRNIRYSMAAIFEIYDVIDKMNHFFNKNPNRNQHHLRLNVNRVSVILDGIIEQYGVVEIDVLNAIFYDDKMEALAFVTTKEWDPGQHHRYQIGQVVAVHQRGFKLIKTGEIIRKALVTVICEETD